jgi:rod shape determining protein RodA
MIRANEYKKIDWPLILCYLILCFTGWISIFSAVYDQEHSQILDMSQRYGMQFIWIVSSFVIAFLVIFSVNPKLYTTLAWIIYGGSILLLIAVIFFGIEVNGSNSWFEIGPVRFQPAEASKIATTLALASLLSSYSFRLKSTQGLIKVGLIILVPVAIIILQKETGSALIYGAFIFMLYREGFSGWVLTLGILAIALFLITLSSSPFFAILTLFSLMIIARGVLCGRAVLHLFILALYLPLMFFSPMLGNLPLIAGNITLPQEAWLAITIAPGLIYHLISAIKSRLIIHWNILVCFIASVFLIFSVELVFEKVLQNHQKSRIENLLGINVDLKGAGYNVHQSMIAIGSGGFSGKGFLQGTQTKFNFVPEQSTDFIFCTIGEEWGFLGTSFIIFIYLFMIIRILNLAEKQKDVFNRIFGYSLSSILFMHFFINIGMTIGIMPVIGIPLPFVSYGGSSLWSFTLFLFIFIRLDLNRWK